MTPHVSVCMATYNGRLHVEEQIDSILRDIGPGDELVVVDDCSTDGTVQIIETLSDPRIRIYEMPRNSGHIQTFECAIEHSRGTLIALSDQDDTWPEGRTARLTEELGESDLVVGNFITFGAVEGQLPRHPLTNESRDANYLNISRLFLGRLPYMGSTMMMRKDFASRCLPFPEYIEAHDQWIGTMANIAGKTVHTSAIVTSRRVHANNLSPRATRALPAVLTTRWIQLRMVREAIRRR